MSIRSLFTSARTLQATIPKSRVSSFVDNAASSSAGPSANPVAMAHDVLHTAVPEQGPRYGFRAGEPVRPYDFAVDPASAPRKPPARPPLLGPPARLARRIDPFHLSSASPLAYALNPSFVHSFTNHLGKIKTRAQTGLTWASQRRVGKMVRRARAMGVVSRWSNMSRPGALKVFEEDQPQNWRRY
ncbi:hypothetical protein Q5752_001418 [Cryptotrichosporon argae]